MARRISHSRSPRRRRTKCEGDGVTRLLSFGVSILHSRTKPYRDGDIILVSFSDLGFRPIVGTSPLDQTVQAARPVLRRLVIAMNDAVDHSRRMLRTAHDQPARRQLVGLRMDTASTADFSWSER